MLVLEHLLLGDADSFECYTALDLADDGERLQLLTLADHPDPQVRRAMVSILPRAFDEPPPVVVDTAIRLTTDPATTVRDWACYALGAWPEVDTAELREALANRLDDLDRDTRSEALLGLAYRKDPRAYPRVRAALSRSSGDLWRLELEAAGALGDPRLHPFVLRYLDGWDEDDLTADAVRRLTDPAGPGADLMRGVADLYAARAHHTSEARWLWARRLMDEMLELAPDRAREFYDGVAMRLRADEAALVVLRDSFFAVDLDLDDQPRPASWPARGRESRLPDTAKPSLPDPVVQQRPPLGVDPAWRSPLG